MNHLTTVAPSACPYGCHPGDYWSGLEQDMYEADLVEEARRIVAGKSDAIPTREHLRILLGWLDGGTAGLVDGDQLSLPF